MTDLQHHSAPEDVAERRAAEALVLDLEGFEGPLDLLLTLARSQKVDLRKISILALAEQYLTFVRAARRLRIELAADYLVMAAWLAFLKSKLLLRPDPQAPAEALAEDLAFRLERLEAMRKAAAQLMARDRLGLDVFARGAPEHVERRRTTRYEATLMDLLDAYGRIEARKAFEPLHVARGPVLAMEEMLARLKTLIGDIPDWTDLTDFLPAAWTDDPKRRRSATAATFAASLELVKAGQAELAQEDAFAPLRMRARG